MLWFQTSLVCALIAISVGVEILNWNLSNATYKTRKMPVDVQNETVSKMKSLGEIHPKELGKEGEEIHEVLEACRRRDSEEHRVHI